MNVSRSAESGRVSPRSGFSATAACALLSLALSLSGCFNNNLGDSTDTALTDTDGGGGDNPFYNGGGTGGTGGGGINSTLARLDRVVYTPSDPGASFDLIGSSGTSALGDLCASSGSEDDPEASTPCRCEYTLEGTSTTIPVNTIYVENNMIRCPRTLIPADTAAVQVRIQFTNFGEFSNSVRVSLGAINSGLDLTLPSSFAQVTRYQCRDYIYIPYMFSGSGDGMYDPFQSDSSMLSYPLNFFTSNPGGTVLARLALGEDQSLWECSMNAANPAKWENLAVFADTPTLNQKLCSNGTVTTGACLGGASGTLISNPKIYVNRTTSTGNRWDRMNFFLAREPTGVFTHPVNAFIAPSVATSVVDPEEQDTSRPGPLGYAAKPTPNTSGGEDCPTTVEIPEDYEWAKLFAWRVGIPSRQYAQTSVEIQRTGGIMCDPGNWPSQTPSGKDVSVAEDCAKTWPPSATADTGSRFPLNDSGSVAARILGNSSMCVLPTTCLPTDTSEPPDGVPDTCDALNPTPGIAGQAYNVSSAYPSGSDLWSRVGAHGAFQISADDFVWVNAGSVGSLDVPEDSEITYRNLDAPSNSPSGGTSRFDILFTVAPTFVKAYDDILDGTVSDVGRFFVPARFLSVDDCRTTPSGTRPDQLDGITVAHDADFANCQQNRLVKYGSFSDDVTTGDGPGTLYPLCVLKRKTQ